MDASKDTPLPCSRPRIEIMSLEMTRRYLSNLYKFNSQTFVDLLLFEIPQKFSRSVYAKLSHPQEDPDGQALRS